MEVNDKKRAVTLGIRISLVFLITVCVMIFVAYITLSTNFQNMLTDYTIKFVSSVAEQGVVSIENELKNSREKTEDLASMIVLPTKEDKIKFPSGTSHPDILRMVYVSEDSTVSSDGRQRDVSNREDVLEAFSGKTSIYGPYFNSENEYVICYSAPIYQNGKINGVLSIEKDGYYFCELIKNILFVDTGESYIINSEGTDIAVSDQEHINWVNDGYNAQKLIKEKDDASVRSIIELEQKGLNGESGVGTYYWEDGLCYVVYIPIPSVNWVLLSGLREEELAAMMKSTLLSSFTKGPILSVCIGLLLLLTALIIFWIISNSKKASEINAKLNILANYDSLTGTKNRNSYQAALESLSQKDYHSIACIYIDANGLHEINNRLGHQAGDSMLKTIADTLFKSLPQSEVYRIGGDEFVVLCLNEEKLDICNKMELVRNVLRKEGYEISIGIEWRNAHMDTSAIVHNAENAMLQDKELYYKQNGKERQIRTLNQEVEQMVLEKQDADTFLSVLAPGFKGVYFVDLGSDTIRHLFIPSYFEEILKESEDKFSSALHLYARRIIKPEYQAEFIKFCQYQDLEAQLNSNKTPEFSYQKIDGTWIKLQILKFKTYTVHTRETLWIFEVVDN